MPACKQRKSLGIRKADEILHLGKRRARRLFEEDVLAGIQRRVSRLVTILRRHAQRHGIDIRHSLQHGLDCAIGRDAVHGAVTACGADQFKIRIACNGGKMLVANDFSDADDGKLGG